jgi:hypothetical protein
MSITTATPAFTARQMRDLAGMLESAVAKLWLERAAVLLEQPAAVLIDMTGGCLQNVHATVPVDLLVIDAEAECKSSDEAPDFIMLDGQEYGMAREAAVVDPDRVARVAAAPTLEQHRAAMADVAPDLDMPAVRTLLSSALFVGLGDRARGVDDNEAEHDRFHVKLESGQVVTVTVAPGSDDDMIASC